MISSVVPKIKVYEPARTKDRIARYQKRTKPLDMIILHCSDSDIPAHDTPEIIDDWHKERGWVGIGYHSFIDKKGVIWSCRPFDFVGSHAYGYNKHSVGICLSGRHRFTQEQFDVLSDYLKFLLDTHELKVFNIFGHYHVSAAKTCPNFDVDKYRKYLRENLGSKYV